MTNLYEQVTADTSYEAKQIALKKYGDNIEIVNTETVKDDIYLGFGKRERVRLTIKRCNDIENNNHINDDRYHSNEYRHNNNTNIHKKGNSSYAPRAIVAPFQAQSSYIKVKEGLRKDIDGLHGIQEGDEDPKPQKLAKNNESHNVTKILEYIDGLQKRRNTENLMTGELNKNKITSQKLEEIQKQIDILTSTIRNLEINSKNFLCENVIQHQGLSDIEKELEEIETPQEIIKELFKDLRLNCSNEILNETKSTLSALHSLIKSKLSISSQFEIKKSNNPQVIVLMGPTGVGKTTTIAKLAAKFCFNPSMPIKACFFNIDFYKLGAKDQLQKYAEIFNIPLEDISSIGSLDYFLGMHKNDDLIIVDTAGRSQYAYKDLEELKSYISRIPNATKYLTVSSTSKYSDLKEIVKSFDQVGFDQIILTKADETKTIGPAVGMLLKSKKSLAYITHGQSVPEDYKIANFDFFEEKIFKTFQNNNALKHNI